MPPGDKPLALKPPIDKWVLTTLDSGDPTPALLWNGLIGIRVGRDASGKDQPFFSIDEYDTTGEEKIRTLQSPLPNGFLVNGKPLAITGGYKQTLDMRTAELATQWDSGNMRVTCLTVMDPSQKVIAEKWTLVGTRSGQITDFDLGPYGPMNGANQVARDVKVGPSGMLGKFRAQRKGGSTETLEFVLSLANSPNLGYIISARGAKNAPSLFHDDPPNLENFSTIEAAAKTTWATRWKTDIEIDGPVEDQQAIHSFLFYLRSAIHAPVQMSIGDMSISPFGLSNQMYNGHIFWDADIWVFPALELLDPPLATVIARYRTEGPSIPLGNLKSPQGEISGFKFAWESSVSGHETVIGPSKQELHVSGDVAWMLGNASALGLEQPIVTQTVIQDIDAYFKSVSRRTSSTGELSIPGVMSPDENHTGDNDLYTNLLAQWVSDGGHWVSHPPTDKSPTYRLPRDDKSFLTYDNDPLKSYKQAAAVLSIYPLQYPPAEAQAKTMMDRFADKVIKNGPAMSDSVHALIWARLGETDKAYRTWKDSWEPFTKQPLMLFSEKRTKPTTYFTTGAGGTLQTILFGFIGFRLDSVKEQGAAWSTKLQGNNWLSVKPNFPGQWKSVMLRNFTVLGHKYTLTATHRPNGPDAVQVTQGD